MFSLLSHFPSLSLPLLLFLSLHLSPSPSLSLPLPLPLPPFPPRSYTQALGGSLDDAVLVNRGLVNMMLGLRENALSDLSTAIDINPFAAHAFFNRGHVRKSLGLLEGARSDYVRGTCDIHTMCIHIHVHISNVHVHVHNTYM